MSHIAILGNGIAGVTAARHLRKLSDHKITLISAESDHFFSRTALMYIYMGHMREKDTRPYENFFWKKNRIERIRGYVENIDFENKELHFDQKQEFDTDFPAPESLSYDKLILAVGSEPNKFGWPGQDLEGVRGLYSLQDLEYLEDMSDKIESAVVVGGGLIGIEMAEMLHSRGKNVHMLVRESNYWDNVLPTEEAQMINQEIREHDIDLRLETELDEIIGNERGYRLSGTSFAEAVVTQSGGRIPCQYVALTPGVHPNVSFLKKTPVEIDKGILVDEYLRTNLDDVYAIGDCAQLKNPPEGRRAIEPVWYVGRMMGETVAYTICGSEQKYDPGIWFNSAKFMNIEYMVYGDIPIKTGADIESLFYKSKDNKRSVRINFHKDSGAVTGFNFMGVRYRQEVCEKWIKEKTHIAKVLQELPTANFDPEFTEMPEKQLIKKYNKEYNSDISLKGKRSRSSLLNLLNI